MGSTRIGRNLVAGHGSGSPVLWLNSHLDTVKAAPEYTFDPWCGEVTDDGKILGLGANDAKGSIAAMAAAMAAFRAKYPEFSGGRVELVAVCDEETGGEGLDYVLERTEPPQSVVVGEPNRMAVANCCKGYVRAEIKVRGASAHASRPWQGVNAVRAAAPLIIDLVADHGLPEDPLLGRATHEITRIEGGEQSNALPALVTIGLDCRTTPAFDNAAMERHLNDIVERYPGVELSILSRRLRATRTPSDGRLVRAALGVRNQSEPTAFVGVCDFVHVGGYDSIIMGPGQPIRSHRPDEFLLVEELEEAVGVYLAVIERYFGLVPSSSID
ncbi:MAG: M20/M25/M40 family metallo-hydrolase [Fimbriimonadaceae bacterium]